MLGEVSRARCRIGSLTLTKMSEWLCVREEREYFLIFCVYVFQSKLEVGVDLAQHLSVYYVL